MAENKETATARYIAANISNQLMLKMLFELVGQIVADDKLRDGMKRAAVRYRGGNAARADVRLHGEEGPQIRPGERRNAADQRASELGREHPEASANVRLGTHSRLKSDITALPKSANRRHCAHVPGPADRADQKRENLTLRTICRVTCVRTVRQPRRQSAHLDRHHCHDGEHHLRRDDGPDDRQRICRCC
jgi:hypothetical protein